MLMLEDVVDVFARLDALVDTELPRPPALFFTRAGFNICAGKTGIHLCNMLLSDI